MAAQGSVALEALAAQRGGGRLVGGGLRGRTSLLMKGSLKRHGISNLQRAAANFCLSQLWMVFTTRRIV